MALSQLNLGSSPNDGTGDTLRAGGAKINLIITQMWDTITGGIAYLGGKVGIGNATPVADLQVGTGGSTIGGTKSILLYDDSVNSDPRLGIRNDTRIYIFRVDGSDADQLKIRDGSVSLDRIILDNSGNFYVPETYNNTTASAANMFIDSTGKHFRSTSSEKLKDNILKIAPEYSANIYRIAKEAAIFYKSLCEGDNPDFTHYGFSAEKLAGIDPRLVHYGYSEDDYEMLIREYEVDEIIKSKIPLVKDKTIKVTKQESYKALKEDAELKPVGVQEIKIIPLMLIEMDRMNDKINDLEQRLLALESK